MNKALQTHTIYLIGIGGIGMSALARYFRRQGKEVSGYDRTKTPLTSKLETEGMNVHYTDDAAFIPCDAGLVIYTPAVPANNRQLAYCRDVDMEVRKRAEVLGMIAEGFKTLAVAGTHGKTTISSMIAHIMHSTGHPVTAFIGGIMNNYDSNLLDDEGSTFMVAEADEYDRSFLMLKPHIAVISRIAADHLDIYGSMDQMSDSFARFVLQIDAGGILVAHESIEGQIPLPGSAMLYGTGNKATLRIENIKVEDHHYHFDLSTPKGRIAISMQVPGRHNVENAAAAAGVCLQCGLSPDEIRRGLATYTGVKRRFEYVVKGKELVYIDDYAHHPEEIEALIRTIRELYPGEEVTGIFQPHLYSRTRDFADEFARSLEALDEIILLDIYPAREEPIKGISAQMLLGKIRKNYKIYADKEDLTEIIKKKRKGVLLTIGAGDIDQLVEPIKKILTEKA